MYLYSFLIFFLKNKIQGKCSLFISAGGSGEESDVRVEADSGGDGRRGGRLPRGHFGGQRHPLHGEGVLCRHFFSHQPQRGGSVGRHFQGEIHEKGLFFFCVCVMIFYCERARSTSACW